MCSVDTFFIIFSWLLVIRGREASLLGFEGVTSIGMDLRLALGGRLYLGWNRSLI